MKKISINIIANMISLWAVSELVDSMVINSFSNLVLLTIILGGLNIFLKPILKILTLPINIISVGLFSFVINAAILKLAFAIIPGVTLTGFVAAILASILLSISNCIIINVLK